jgi:hypothetical protein
VSGDRGDLAAQHCLGLPRLALGLGLSDARDHGEPGFERRLAASPDCVVGLAEQLTALRVADDRALDAQLEEHRSRDLAREGALTLPVDVLRVDRDTAADRCDERRERRAHDHLDPRRRRERLEECNRLGRPLEHLPVARDEHEG